LKFIYCGPNTSAKNRAWRWNEDSAMAIFHLSKTVAVVKWRAVAVCQKEKKGSALFGACCHQSDAIII
jgi:hypothetical protein